MDVQGVSCSVRVGRAHCAINSVDFVVLTKAFFTLVQTYV